MTTVIWKSADGGKKYISSADFIFYYFQQSYLLSTFVFNLVKFKI